MEILENEDSTIINWDENGRSFQVLDSECFCKDVLPKYFRHRKLTSFQRQLNLYGFQRVHVGPLGGAYYHPLFRKDAPANCDNIKRHVKKNFIPHIVQPPAMPPFPGSTFFSIPADIGVGPAESTPFPWGTTTMSSAQREGTALPYQGEGRIKPSSGYVISSDTKCVDLASSSTMGMDIFDNGSNSSSSSSAAAAAAAAAATAVVTATTGGNQKAPDFQQRIPSSTVAFAAAEAAANAVVAVFASSQDRLGASHSSPRQNNLEQSMTVQMLPPPPSLSHAATLKTAPGAPEHLVCCSISNEGNNDKSFEKKLKTNSDHANVPEALGLPHRGPGCLDKDSNMSSVDSAQSAYSDTSMDSTGWIENLELSLSGNNNSSNAHAPNQSHKVVGAEVTTAEAVVNQLDDKANRQSTVGLPCGSSNISKTASSLNILADASQTRIGEIRRIDDSDSIAGAARKRPTLVVQTNKSAFEFIRGAEKIVAYSNSAEMETISPRKLECIVKGSKTKNVNVHKVCSVSLSHTYVYFICMFNVNDSTPS